MNLLLEPEIALSDLKFISSEIKTQALLIVPEGKGKGVVHYTRIPE